MSERRKKNSSKVNLTISFIFHSVLIAAIFYFAAREGMLGKKMKTIVAEMVKEKKPAEPPKQREEPKVQQAKQVEQPKTMAAAPQPQVQSAAPPPATEAPPVAAPPSVDVGFFSDGAKETVDVTDPKLLYKGLVELALRSRWNRPEDVADDTYVAEVELNIDPDGKVTGSKWLKGSGDARWDKSVKDAVAATKTISRSPPKGFPGKFVAKFDVEMTKTEDVFKVSTVQ
jgi:TonB family protein